MLITSQIYNNLKSNLPEEILSGNSKIIVGLSGGSDSRLLLDFLLSSIKDSKKNIIVAHVNYKLREKESDRDEDLVIKICKSENLILEKLHERLDKKSRGIQEKARNIRLKFFSDLSEKYQTKHIFLGHNFNDHIESIMLIIIRGSGLNGLEGIKKKNKIKINKNTLFIYRPLIDIKKQLIEDICKKEKLEFIIDSSNKKNDYSRNKLRNQIIPQIEKINPKFTNSLKSLSDLVTKSKSKKKIKFGKYKGLGINQGIEILSDQYKNLRNNSSLSRIHFEMFEKILSGESYSENLPQRIKIARCNEDIIFEDLSVKQIKVELNKKISVPGKTKILKDIEIVTKLIDKPKKLETKNKNSIYINEKYIKKNLSVRLRNEGDKINSMPNIYTRVKKVLSNTKNVKDKQNAIILESDKEILWVIGVKQSISSYVGRNNKKVLEIRLLENPVKP